MRVTIKNLNIEYFKGIQKKEFAFNGLNAVLTGENETKKTTVKDAFHWLFYGKDSAGRTDSGKGSFAVRPHYENGDPIEGVTVMVEAEMNAEGEIHTLRKEQAENKIKGKITGYTNQFFVDGGLLLKKDFDKFIAEHYAAEDVCKLLTDVFYFCGELHHLKRRAILVELAGEVKRPEGFDDMHERANGQELEAYRKALVFKRDGDKNHDGYKKEQEKIPTRMEEILKGMEQPEGSLEATSKSRDEAKKKLESLKTVRSGVLAAESDRQKLIGEKNRLTVEIKKREIDLQNDPARTQAITDEKAKITARLSQMGNVITEREGKLSQAKTKKQSIESRIKIKQNALESVRREQKHVESEPSPDICYACKQELPEAMKAQVAKERAAKIADIQALGNEAQKEIDDWTVEIEILDDSILNLKKVIDTAKESLEAERDSAANRIKVLDAQMKKLPPVVPEQDQVYFNLLTELRELEAEIGEPAAEQLEKLNRQIEVCEGELNTLNGILNKYDRIESDRARIIELKDREKELAQLIADIDKEIDLIKQYNLAYSRLVEEAVNDKFEHTTFKLFDFQINGEIDDRVCEAMNKGSKWVDMSTGQKIFVGTDVINTLSEHYGIVPPLFIDHAGEITLPIVTKAQTIKLKAVDGVKQLTLTTEAKEKAKVA